MYDDIKNILLKNFPTLSFIQLVTEKTDKGIVHYHFIVAIRNFIDYNYTLKNNIFLVLNKELSIDTDYGGKFDYKYDIKINSFLYFKDIKN